MITVNKTIHTNIDRKNSIANDKLTNYYDIDIWNNSLDTVAQKNAIKTMISNWFNTNRTERFCDYEYGNDLFIYLKKSVNNFMDTFDFKSWLQRLETQVQVISCISEKSTMHYDKETQSVQMHIVYNIRNTLITDEIDVSMG